MVYLDILHNKSSFTVSFKNTYFVKYMRTAALIFYWQILWLTRIIKASMYKEMFAS